MGAGESNPEQLNCKVVGPAAVGDAVSAARAFAVLQGITDADVIRLCVVIEELVANLYEHGGVSCGDGVELSLSCATDGIRIVLVDPGQPFDPRKAPSRRPRTTREGGFGINIVQAWTRFVDYGIQANGNRLELLMPIRKQRIVSGF